MVCTWRSIPSNVHPLTCTPNSTYKSTSSSQQHFQQHSPIHRPRFLKTSTMANPVPTAPVPAGFFQHLMALIDVCRSSLNVGSRPRRPPRPPNSRRRRAGAANRKYSPIGSRVHPVLIVFAELAADVGYLVLSILQEMRGDVRQLVKAVVAVTNWSREAARRLRVVIKRLVDYST